MQKKPRSSCLFCGKECKRSTTIFCSLDCRGQYQTLHKIRYGGSPLRVVEKICAFCKKSFMPNNWKLEQKFCNRRCMGLARADDCAALGRSQKGTTKSIKARQNMSKAQSKRAASTSYTKGIGGLREDIGHYVRSSWEANIARILIYEGIDYKFEPDVLELVDGNVTIFYKPDFKLSDRYIEVKGWWTEKSKKIKDLLKDYPEIRIEYITEVEYKMLQEFYISLIPNWELDRRRACK